MQVFHMNGKAISSSKGVRSKPKLVIGEFGLTSDFSDDNLLDLNGDIQDIQNNTPKPPSEKFDGTKSFQRKDNRGPSNKARNDNEIEFDAEQFNSTNKKKNEISKSFIYKALLDSDQAKKSLQKAKNITNTADKIKNKSFSITETMFENKIVRLKDRVLLESVIANSDPVLRHKVEKEVNEKTLYNCYITQKSSEKVRVSLIEKEVMKADDKLVKKRSNSWPNLDLEAINNDTTKDRAIKTHRVRTGAINNNSVIHQQKTRWDSAMPLTSKEQSTTKTFRRRSNSASDVNSVKNESATHNNTQGPLAKTDSSVSTISNFHIRKLVAAGPKNRENGRV